MVDLAGRRGHWLMAAAAAAMFALLVAGELYQDEEPLTLGAVLLELLSLALLVGGTLTSALLGARMRAQEEESRLLRQDVEVIRAEGHRWHSGMADQIRDLGAGMRRQLEDWGLTAAEEEVALFLLRGLSHKEIARLRDTSDITIRQQAASMYRKAGLSGRAALSAFFLDELLGRPPVETTNIDALLSEGRRAKMISVPR